MNPHTDAKASICLNRASWVSLPFLELVPLHGGNSVGKRGGLPIGSDPWLPERFNLAEEQEKPQDCRGRCQQERRPMPGRHLRWEVQIAQGQVCSAHPALLWPGPRGLMGQGQGPSGTLAAGLSGPQFWRARNKQASKPRAWLAEGGWILHLCPLSLPAHIRP